LWDTFPELVGQDLTRKAVDLYRERFLDTGWKENKPYDGIVDALETVASAGHLMFVATAKPHMHAARIIEHFGMGEFFATVYGSELDGAVANAMTPVGVAYGYGSVEELTAAGATAIAVSPADLPGILT
jgi:phosphoglycolate phosphatase